ncbi:S8 family serine peptidase [Bacillus sp. SCS-151]|uniref:S8 family serine peptidase n=1 Tax=Nanhaiella sioensis TaxID=3115293 RepID=UPI00397B2BBE
MKKWQKSALSLGLATSLLAPSFASASTTLNIEPVVKEELPFHALDQFNLKEQKSLLAMNMKADANEQISEDTLIIKYNKKLSNTVHNRAGTTLKRSMPTLGYDIVTVKKGQSLQEVVNYYASQNNVVNISPSYTYEKLGVKADPKAKDMYHLSLLQIDEALSLAGDHAVTVAVIDTGIGSDHPELKSQILPPYNAVNPASQGVADLHGTHVAGIVSGEANNGVGGYGINPNAKILPIDVFNGGFGAYDYSIAEGILYAIDNEADVINMSLGSPFPSPIVDEAVQKAIDAGIVIVAAAGNNATDDYFYPAAHDRVISVGATNDKNNLADFSNFGPQVDIVAPGEGIYSSIFDTQKNASSFLKADGTSMASPVVAGVVSLLLSKYPDLQPYEVEAVLERTATDLGEAGYDLTYANGLVNPVAALQYDITQLPERIQWDDEKILSEASLITFSEDRFTTQGKLQSPEERHWLKVNLEEGQSIQTILEAADNYDYKLELRFYPATKTEASETIEVNDVVAGGLEGSLFTAIENGMLAIGVTDTNGNYSLQGKSSYELTVNRYDELHEDGLTIDNPAMITSLPFDSEQLEMAPLTMLSVDNKGEKVNDKDYFALTVEELQAVNISLSELPGVNTSLNVYFAEDLELADEYGLWPFASANTGTSGEGESVTFEAMPGMEYIIEISSEQTLDFFSLLFLGMDLKNDVSTSAVPYHLLVEKVDFPVDEDSLSFEPTPEEELMSGEIDKSAYMTSKKNAAEDQLDLLFESSWSEFSPEEVELIMATAIDYTIGEQAEGYFQYSGDSDFYTFMLDQEQDAILQFDLNKMNTMIPTLTVYEYNEEEQTLNAVNQSFSFLMEMEETPTITIPLEKDKQYYAKVENGSYQPAKEMYEMSSKIVYDVPFDENEKNDEPLQSTILKPNVSVNGSFIFADDVDTYYYKHRSEEELFGLSVKVNQLTDQQKLELPSEIKSPLMLGFMIVEDTNGNMFIDGDEARKSIVYEPDFVNVEGDLNGSFKAREGIGYFVVAMNYGSIFFGQTVKSYDIALNTLDSQDEDADSVVTNNIPSMPLQFVKNEDVYEAVGYLNAGVDFGDKDYYQFDVSNSGEYEVSLQIPSSIDGDLTIYSNEGYVVKTFDHYGSGDEEIGTVQLTEGTYYFEVKDSQLNASNEPYTLHVKSTN